MIINFLIIIQGITMIEKMADDLIGQMTEARLIDKDMEERYIYVFICWIEKFITVGSIILSLIHI